MPNLCVIPARAAEDPRLTFRDLRALMAVGMYTNHAGKGVWASQKTMADRVNMTRPQMNESLRRLEAFGYIRRTARTTEGGATLTSIIDIVLDAPEVGVPKSGTGGVPDLGTGGVPDLGTQTNYNVNDVTTDNNSNSASAQVADAIPPAYRADLDLLLAGAKNPESVVRELVALNNGMHGAFSWDTIGRAVHDMAVAGAPVSPRTLRVFCEGVHRPSSATNQHGKAKGVDIERIKEKLGAGTGTTPQPPPD